MAARDERNNDRGGNRNPRHGGGGFGGEVAEELGSVLGKSKQPIDYLAAWMVNRGKTGTADIQALALALRTLNDRGGHPPLMKDFLEGFVQGGTSRLEFKVEALMALPEPERAAEVAKILAEGKPLPMGVKLPNTAPPRSPAEERDAVSLYGYMARIPNATEKQRFADVIFFLKTDPDCAETFAAIVSLQKRAGFLDQLRSRVVGLTDLGFVKPDPLDVSTWISVADDLMVTAVEDLLVTELAAAKHEAEHKAMTGFDHLARATSNGFKAFQKVGGQINDAIAAAVPPPPAAPAGLPGTTTHSRPAGSAAATWARYKTAK